MTHVRVVCFPSSQKMRLWLHVRSGLDFMKISPSDPPLAVEAKVLFVEKTMISIPLTSALLSVAFAHKYVQ